MKGAIGHVTRIDQLFPQGPELKPSQHVGGLIKRNVTSLHRSPDLRRSIARLMTYFFHEEGNRLFSAHFSQMKTQGEKNARTTVGSPEQHPQAILCRALKTQIPQKHFPIQGPAFHQKGCAKELTVCAVAIGHEKL